MTAYFSIFHSHLTYAILAWGHSPGISRVFRLQRKALRLIGGLHFADDCRTVFKRMNVLTLPSIYIFQNLLYIKENLHCFVAHENIHNYTTRNRECIAPIYWRLRRCQTGPGYWAIKLYNVLPKHFKSMRLKDFKREIKKFLIDNSFYTYHEFMDFNFSLYCPT